MPIDNITTIKCVALNTRTLPFSGYALVYCALLVVSGCASAPPAVDALRPGSHLVVLQLPTSVDDSELTRVLHGEQKDVSAVELSEDRTELQQSIATALSKAFARS